MADRPGIRVVPATSQYRSPARRDPPTQQRHLLHAEVWVRGGVWRLDSEEPVPIIGAAPAQDCHSGDATKHRGELPGVTFGPAGAAARVCSLPGKVYPAARPGGPRGHGEPRPHSCRARRLAATVRAGPGCAGGFRLARAEAKMIKSRKAKGRAGVTFTLDPRVGAQTAAVCGEWNDWSASADVMRRDSEGGFSLIVDLEAGRAYRFRYLLDDQRWENDWAADAYLPNSFGGDDSVVDLTALAKAAPPAAKKASAKDAAPAEKEPAAKAAPTRTARKASAPAAKPARRTTK